MQSLSASLKRLAHSPLGELTRIRISATAAQTPITNDNFQAAVQACVAEDPVALNCPGTEFGAAATWSTGAVQTFGWQQGSDSIFCPGGTGVDSPLTTLSALANWDTGAGTDFSMSAPSFAFSCWLCLKSSTHRDDRRVRARSVHELQQSSRYIRTG